jgi:hypothetical protein
LFAGKADKALSVAKKIIHKIGLQDTMLLRQAEIEGFACPRADFSVE